MDPLMLQYASFFEVVELYADLRRMQIRQEGAEQKPRKKSNVIRRRASDDAGWW